MPRFAFGDKKKKKPAHSKAPVHDAFEMSQSQPGQHAGSDEEDLSEDFDVADPFAARAAMEEEEEEEEQVGRRPADPSGAGPAHLAALSDRSDDSFDSGHQSAQPERALNVLQKADAARSKTAAQKSLPAEPRADGAAAAAAAAAAASTSRAAVDKEAAINVLKGLHGIADAMQFTTGKTPATAYRIYCTLNRPKLKLQQPGLSFGEVAKLLGEMWKGLPELENKPYHEAAAAAKILWVPPLPTEKPAKPAKATKKAKVTKEVKSSGGAGSGGSCKRKAPSAGHIEIDSQMGDVPLCEDPMPYFAYAKKKARKGAKRGGGSASREPDFDLTGDADSDDDDLEALDRAGDSSSSDSSSEDERPANSKKTGSKTSPAPAGRKAGSKKTKKAAVVANLSHDWNKDWNALESKGQQAGSPARGGKPDILHSLPQHTLFPMTYGRNLVCVQKQVGPVRLPNRSLPLQDAMIITLMGTLAANRGGGGAGEQTAIPTNQAAGLEQVPVSALRHLQDSLLCYQLDDLRQALSDVHVLVALCDNIVIPDTITVHQIDVDSAVGLAPASDDDDDGDLALAKYSLIGYIVGKQWLIFGTQPSIRMTADQGCVMRNAQNYGTDLPCAVVGTQLLKAAVAPPLNSEVQKILAETEMQRRQDDHLQHAAANERANKKEATRLDRVQAREQEDQARKDEIARKAAPPPKQASYSSQQPYPRKVTTVPPRQKTTTGWIKRK